MSGAFSTEEEQTALQLDLGSVWRREIVSLDYHFPSLLASIYGNIPDQLQLIIILHPTSQLHTAAPHTANSAQNQAQSRKQEVKRRKKGQARKSWWLGGRGVGNERWHAGHLNAKAEGIDSVSASPVCKP